jgi:pyruvate kinase
MLSGETASGKYPVEAVKMMDSIVHEAEKHTDEWSLSEEFPKEALKDDALSIASAARELAHDRNVTNIAVFTQSGKTALLMSKARPRVPILAYTPVENTMALTNLYWGVTPVLVPFANSLEDMVKSVDDSIQSRGNLKPGEQIVLISGFPVGAMRLPNLALLHTVGEDV